MYEKRLLALGIDLITTAFIQFLLMMIFIMIPLLTGTGDSNNVVLINFIITGVSLLYLILRDLPGKSLGKRIVKVKIVRFKTDESVNIGSRVLRNITWILGPVEILVLLIKRRRLGDFLAKTDVV